MSSLNFVKTDMLFDKPGVHLGVAVNRPLSGKAVLEVMRQPLEDRRITVSRAKYSIDYPAGFMLVASMNPNMDGRRLAIIDLPEPGAPTSSILWPPAQATSKARLTLS